MLRRPVLLPAVCTAAALLASSTALASSHREAPFITGMPKERFTPAGGEATLSGIYLETDDRTGRATRVVPVRQGGTLHPSAP